MKRLLPVLAIFACAQPPAEEPPPIDRPGADVLELPDISDIDMAVAYKDALRLATTVVANKAWDSHVNLLESRTGACPDIYVGVPADDIDELDMDAEGSSWLDYCDESDGRSWSGWAWWDATAQANGDVAAPEGLTLDGDRTLIAKATIGQDSGALWELNGEISESVHVASGDGGAWTTWTWSSLMEGTFTGSDSFDLNSAETPSGYRTDLYLYASGGDVSRFEARGNVYLFDGLMHDRFDSMVTDIEILGENGAGPDDCKMEPRGWIGLRDRDAVWYDLIFLPRSEDNITDSPYPNDPLSECDGCGTLYLRGVESGEVCVDFSFVFDEGVLVPPDVSTFVLPHRGLP